ASSRRDPSTLFFRAREQAVVDALGELLQRAFARIERTMLKVDERRHVERLLVREGALLTHRHIGPDKTGQALRLDHSSPGVVRVDAPYRRDGAFAFAVVAVANRACALVHRLSSRRVRVGPGE